METTTQGTRKKFNQHDDLLEREFVVIGPAPSQHERRNTEKQHKDHVDHNHHNDDTLPLSDDSDSDLSTITHDRSLMRAYEHAQAMARSNTKPVSRETLLTIQIMQECFRIKGRIQLLKNRNSGSMYDSPEHNEEFFKYLRLHHGNNCTVRSSWHLYSNKTSESSRMSTYDSASPCSCSQSNSPQRKQDRQSHHHNQPQSEEIRKLRPEPRWVHGSNIPVDFDDKERPPPASSKMIDLNDSDATSVTIFDEDSSEGHTSSKHQNDGHTRQPMHRYRPNPFKSQQGSNGYESSGCDDSLKVIKLVPTDEMTTSTAEELELLNTRQREQRQQMLIMNNPRWPLAFDSPSQNQKQNENQTGFLQPKGPNQNQRNTKIDRTSNVNQKLKVEKKNRLKIF